MLKRFKSLIGDRNPLRMLWHNSKVFLAALRYGFPARKLCVIGITGTDGKTTTVGMLSHILLHSGVDVGAASTTHFQVRENCEENETHLTSINPFTLQRFLRRLVSENCTHAVIEMSSHGLVQGRVSFTWPSVCAITNLTLESLDYHKTIDQYRNDKGIMFRMLQGKGTKVLNAADEAYDFYNRILSKRTITYGTEHSDISVHSAQTQSRSTKAVMKIEGTTKNITLNIPGAFNLENAMCAIGCATAIGISADESIAALDSFEAIAGRMQRIEEGQDFDVFVDFTVTPAAYETTLSSLRSIVGDDGKVLALFGGIGNRMPEKRAMIGGICSALADIIVVTEDETYGEDPHAVLEEVWEGVDQETCEAHKIFDRREAIEFLCKKAQKGDAVILCGMGPFTTFNKPEGPIEWDEREVEREVLRAL